MRKYLLTIMAGLVLGVGACNTDPVSNLNQVSPGTSHSGFEERFMGVLWTERFDFGTRVTMLDAFARDAGIPHVVSGPLVRSSYHADGQAALVRALRQR